MISIKEQRIKWISARLLHINNVKYKLTTDPGKEFAEKEIEQLKRELKELEGK